MNKKESQQQNTEKINGFSINSITGMASFLDSFQDAENPSLEARNELLPITPEDNEESLDDALKEYFQIFTEGSELSERYKEEKASDILNLVYPEKDNYYVQGVEKSAMDVRNRIKNVVKNKLNKESKKKVFNLSKYAQHKSMDNVLMYGPDEMYNDMFYRGPASRWSLIERNKGFGLVVDDIWDINYEKLWRENIMDAYSTAYYNEDGVLEGGYLNKRFEINRDVSDINDLQLRNGETRKPVLRERGNIGARMEEARDNGEIEGSQMFDKKEEKKSFNLQQFYSKKAHRGIAEGEDPLEYKSPWDKDMKEHIQVCPYCNATISDSYCENCKKTVTPIMQPPKLAPDTPKSAQFNKDFPIIEGDEKDENDEEIEKVLEDLAIDG